MKNNTENETVKQLELQKLAGGALQELFDNDLQKVLQNITDVNTSFKAARKLTLEIVFKPADEDREIVMVEAKTKTSLASVNGVATKIMIDRSGDRVSATEFGNALKNQMTVDDFVEPENVNVEDGENVVNFKAE
jgi:hypothetical protein